jgi:hypothetical protein
MNFLRLLTISAHQQITYRCKNSMAIDDKQNSVDLIGYNYDAMNMKSSEDSRYTLTTILDDCKVCLSSAFRQIVIK